MPFVFVIARDWTLRTAVRAELRERGFEALGMDSPADAGRAVSSNRTPAAVVLEGAAEFLSNPGIQDLVSRVPTVLIASRTERIRLPAGQTEPGLHPRVVLYRPVRVGEIVSVVLELLEKGPTEQ